MAFWVSVICIAVYVVVSLLGRDPEFDLDALLHREPGERRRLFQFGPEVPRGDRILIPVIFGLVGLALGAHLLVGAYSVGVGVPSASWLDFWPKYLYAMFALGAAFLVWITIGGFRDLVRLVRALRHPQNGGNAGAGTTRGPVDPSS